MVFTILLAVAAFVAGILVERNNAFVGTILVNVKNTVFAIVSAIKGIFVKKS